MPVERRRTCLLVSNSPLSAFTTLALPIPSQPREPMLRTPTRNTRCDCAGSDSYAATGGGSGPLRCWLGIMSGAMPRLASAQSRICSTTSRLSSYGGPRLATRLWTCWHLAPNFDAAGIPECVRYGASGASVVPSSGAPAPSAGASASCLASSSPCINIRIRARLEAEAEAGSLSSAATSPNPSSSPSSSSSPSLQSAA